MTDRELLERAARAAGIEVGWIDPVWGNPEAVPYIHLPGGKLWNPLTNDGDEARLEAALQMHVNWMPGIDMVSVGTAETECREPYGQDRQKARRRAGVRAAAAMADQPATAKE